MQNLILFGFIWIFSLGCGIFTKKQTKAQRLVEGFTLEIDGRVRNYLVHTPPNYDSRKKYPLLLAIHGARGNPAGMREVTRFDELSKKEEFIVVYPFGTTADEKIGYFWNAWECCGYALQHEVNDVKFIKKLISNVKEDFSIHPAKIYAAGFSNGGMMSLRLACEISEEFAAVASVGGSMFHENCKPSKPLPVYFIQGKKDRVVPVEGGVGKNSSTPSAKLPSFQMFQFWSGLHECMREKSIEDNKKIIYEALDCKSKKRVKMTIVKEEAHTWPQENYPASEEIWKFLKQWTLDSEKYPS